ncbi:MAG TPA: hypothetical protein VGO80_15210 [Solirubrobacteraceae bacterium]|jgi:hypothetical protein|nr:hypothetical protein [Solirubrobacteraceae bacterium]
MSTPEKSKAIGTSPTSYTLQGDGLHVSYSTTSFQGMPHFDYHDGHITQSFVGDEIRTEQTEIGTLVTVTIMLTADRGATSFSLLLPTVNVGPSKSASISTIGITTRHRFAIPVSLNLGQTELYTVTQLTGTAEDVDF